MAAGILYERVALIGIGLIGSSLARALRVEDLAGHIVGCARTAATLETARRLGLCDTTSQDPAAAAADADLVVLCTPLGTYRDLATAIAPALKPGATVTDVGSAKRCVIEDVGPRIPQGVHFIPGHPVAGTEHSGPEAGFAELFHGRYCVLTPPPGVDAAALDRLAEMWRRCGMDVETMDAEHHDLVLAITSHLPHLIAYTIVGTATDIEGQLRAEVAKFSAGGFRDFTRIAASDPIMWRDVFLNNRDAVLEVLGRFSEDLSALQRAIRWGEGDKLEQLFERTRDIRRSVIDAKQAYDEVEPPHPTGDRD
ncbi:MAG: prephenate/arogenate dehydrogenase family protein [Alphaproteobacteria bacterium]|nr:prephenate/arogenate dehydrogenase family protein [Alphaproteobacteria bacterium]